MAGTFVARPDGRLIILRKGEVYEQIADGSGLHGERITWKYVSPAGLPGNEWGRHIVEVSLSDDKIVIGLRSGSIWKQERDRENPHMVKFVFKEVPLPGSTTAVSAR